MFVRTSSTLLKIRNLLLRVPLALVCLTAQAHLDLYHHLEVSLTEPDKITIFAMIHDSDLGDRDFREFLRDAYDFRLDGAPFEISASLDETAEELPEGCRLALATFPNPGQQLLVSLAPNAEKRLLLVITRPGVFPETRDLARGDSRAIDLPEPPPLPAKIGRDWLVVIGLVIFGVVGLGLWRLRFKSA